MQFDRGYVGRCFINNPDKQVAYLDDPRGFVIGNPVSGLTSTCIKRHDRVGIISCFAEIVVACLALKAKSSRVRRH